MHTKKAETGGGKETLFEKETQKLIFINRRKRVTLDIEEWVIA
jgi:hypothetical protein